MIISPPLLRDKTANKTDAAWVNEMIPVDANHGFPINKPGAWHGGVHIKHSDVGSNIEKIRAIADGEVIFVRQSSDRRNDPPYNYKGKTDYGCVVLRHKTEIGTNGEVTFFSLYMHLRKVEDNVKTGSFIYRKEPLGTVGQVYDINAIHFQIFCDDANLDKLVGRKVRKLDISKDGRTDTVYGDMHFYLPQKTKFYSSRPQGNSPTPQGAEIHTSTEELFVTMSFAKGKCTMTTRKHAGNERYEIVGESIPNDNYEYNLYNEAVKLYPQSPSAGYEMLRFGRVINTGHEILSPTNAPHWREVSYPGGRGWVNLANMDKDEKNKVKKFSDADFPHWMGWQLIDDDQDSNSQCNSQILLDLDKKTDEKTGKKINTDLSRMICHFPLEWNGSTAESRFAWLKEEKDKFIKHVQALCIDMAGLPPSDRVWHFDPRQFITHFRKCGWLSKDDIVRVVRRYEEAKPRPSDRANPMTRNALIGYLTNEGKTKTKDGKERVIRPSNIHGTFQKILNKYCINTPLRIAHLIGQMAKETGRFKYFIELGNDDYFKRYGPDTTTGQNLGNNQKGDGLRFKGRGIIHLTGRDNYSRYGKYKNKNKPEHFTTEPNNDLLVKDSYYASDAGGYYWASKQKLVGKNLVPQGELGINYWADKGHSDKDAKELTGRINVGRDGFAEVRWPAFEHAWYVLNDEITKPDNYCPINS